MPKKLLKGTGLSFSLKRLLGLTGLRLKIAHALGIPTTRDGLERKIGRLVLKLFFWQILLLLAYQVIHQF